MGTETKMLADELRDAAHGEPGNTYADALLRAAAALEQKDSALFLLVSSDIEWPARVELRMAVERCRAALAAGGTYRTHNRGTHNARLSL